MSRHKRKSDELEGKQKKIYTFEQLKEFERFYYTALKRMQKDYSEKAIFDGKPEGFSEWLKITWTERKKKRKVDGPKIEATVICWNCEKEYPENENRCPFCGAFTVGKK